MRVLTDTLKYEIETLEKEKNPILGDVVTDLGRERAYTYTKNGWELSTDN